MSPSLNDCLLVKTSTHLLTHPPTHPPTPVRWPLRARAPRTRDGGRKTIRRCSSRQAGNPPPRVYPLQVSIERDSATHPPTHLMGRCQAIRRCSPRQALTHPPTHSYPTVARSNHLLLTHPPLHSLTYYHSDAEVDYILTAVHHVAEHGYKWLPHYRFNHRTGEWRHHRWVGGWVGG